MRKTARSSTTLTIAVGLAMLASIAGCSSSPSPHPSATGSALAAERVGDATFLIVQCALTRGLMKPPTGLWSYGKPPFVKGTKLTITGGNAGLFNEWYTGFDALKIAGKELWVWVDQTAASGKLPAAVCGTSVTASELHRQVFADDPQAPDPW